MELLNALDLKKGKTVKRTNRFGTLSRPVQFLPAKDKDLTWAIDNIDWLEREGMNQIRGNAKRMLKNYRLAEGIIDKSDYIVSPDNEFGNLVDILTREGDAPTELKFYPIVPNIMRILSTEFAKRASKLTFRAVDDISYSELLEEKRKMIEENLLQRAQAKQTQRMVEMGLEPDSEEAQQMMKIDTLKTLPEIEEFFKKDYRSTVEKWANVQHKVDEERFKMAELELIGFQDSLTVGREFWHFKMMENDYDVEIWNPVFTFFQKSPGQRYISSGQYVGKIDLLTISDVIDTYGYLMDEDQLESLERDHAVQAEIYNMPGIQNDGSFYNASKSHKWNTNFPSLGMRQYQTANRSRFDIDEILKTGQDVFDQFDDGLVRVTTVYWKSQRRVGHLIKKTLDGSIIQKIVTENYKITEKPEYNSILFREKTKDSLIYGEHIDWIWINDVWGGVKIGMNKTTEISGDDINMSPIYLGIDRETPGRLKFQFKGDSSLYGCKLPVEGRVFGDRNTKSTTLVDLTRPFQIQYNLVNNQIADILTDELGTVIALDHNAVPKHSMGEDWGRGNLAKMYVAAKNFQMMPFDTSSQNTEGPLNFSHYQVLNMEQTNRLLSRVNLATYFKQQTFEVIGITPQRLGQEIGRQTAKGVEQNMNASYAQTEMYFIQHTDELMPRVHQMRTDLAQYYHSTNPSLRLQYMTALEEKVNFELQGIDLLAREFNIYCTTKTNHREVMEQLRQLAINNNTSGASIFDLGNILKADSLAELDVTMKTIEAKAEAQRQQQMQHEQQLEQQRLDAEEKKYLAEQEFEATENQLDRQNEITVAEVRAAGYGADSDINKNAQSDYLDAMDRIEKSRQYQDTMNFKREQESTKMQLSREQLNLKREEIQNRLQISDKQLQIARENKNRYDVQKSKSDKEKSHKK